MGAIYKPTEAGEISELVTLAVAENHSLEILGRGSKRGLGPIPLATDRLDLSSLSGVMDYDPDELVITVQAGTKITDIEALLKQNAQMLAFEPVDMGPLLGVAAGESSIGGIISTNLAGPRRIRAGASRDHLLGYAGVNGRGEFYKSGGKVVKNVTGYDLCKLMCGAYGTLTVLTEISLRVFPQPEEARTVLIHGLDDPGALMAMSQALNSPLEVSGAAHLPRWMLSRSKIETIRSSGTALTALRIEGAIPSITARCLELRNLMGYFGVTEDLQDAESDQLWLEIRDVAYFCPTKDPLRIRSVWRISIPASAAFSVLETIRFQLGGDISADIEYFLDWGGSQVWLSVPLCGDKAAVIRHAAEAVGGYATLIIANEETSHAGISLFNPLQEDILALTKNVKESFDPAKILNPGRLYSGI